MRKLVVERAVGASGVGLKPGKQYDVPGDVSEQDAKILTGLGKARFLDEPKPKAETAQSVEAQTAETAESPAAPKAKRSSAKPRRPQQGADE